MATILRNPPAPPVESWGDLWPSSHDSLPIPPAAGEPARALAARPKAVAWVRMAPDVLRAMALAAKHAGRTVGDVWAEAARDWLLRKSLEAEFDMSYLPERQRDEGAHKAKQAQLWSVIDASMEMLRQPRPTI
jgi:hypothetical protein